MKKIIAVLCVAFALAFCGCGVLENPYSSSSSQDAASESVSETPSAEDSSVEDSVGALVVVGGRDCLPLRLLLRISCR